MLKNNLHICILLILALASCSDPENPQRLSGHDFYPLETGRYSEFGVQRTVYTVDRRQEVSQYRIRQVTGDTIPTTDGRKVYQMRYAVKELYSDWKTDSVNASWHTADKAIEQENGKPVIKINFPLSEGAQWDINALNNLGKQIGFVRNLSRPYQLPTISFQNTITVIRQDDSTLLSRKKYIEIYAANVGLIRRERVTLEYCYTGDCVGKGIINSGWKEVITLENFGKQ